MPETGEKDDMSLRVTPLLWTVLIAAAALGLARPSHGEDGADLILRHGVFYPVQPPGRVEGSLAVRGGRIVYLGPDAGADKLRGSRTRVIDLAGRAVTPGLIDAHSHLAGLGQALQQVDLTGTGSYEEVVRKVREAASRLPAGAWVRGRGWDQNDWQEKKFPTHEALSAAVPDHPVWLTRVDGHAALVNARAMQVLGIDAALQDPCGGRFLRGEGGRPTGVLVDNAKGMMEDRLPEPSVEDRQRALRLAARHCVELGLTTVTDMGIGDADYRAYSALRHAGELPLRAALFLTDDEPLLAHWFQRGPEIDPQARVLVRGVKLYIDGALGSRGAALVEPYSDDAGNLGLLVSTGDHLEDIPRMARLGIIASMQPTHATSDMPWAVDRLGERRLAGAYAWRKVLDAGGRLALGSDFPVESADPRLGLYAAVTRQDLSGQPAGGWLPGERLTREEALRGFTLDAAWSLFLEKEVGSLEVGKRADLVVFARDIMTVPEREIPKVEVDYTLVDGQIEYEREGRRR